MARAVDVRRDVGVLARAAGARGVPVVGRDDVAGRFALAVEAELDDGFLLIASAKASRTVGFRSSRCWGLLGLELMMKSSMNELGVEVTVKAES